MIFLKSRYGRLLSAFGYAKLLHDEKYTNEYNDGTSGVSNTQPTAKIQPMAKMKQLESQIYLMLKLTQPMVRFLTM